MLLMATPGPQSQLLAGIIGRVRAAWPEARWEWDPRFGCALSTVTKAQEAAAWAALSAVLPAVWTGKTLSDGPALVRETGTKTGGLRGDQKMFSENLEDGAIVYCLWWPWGSGSNFSARVGARGTDRGEEHLASLVRSAFDLR
jgi:hypothetical protein